MRSIHMQYIHLLGPPLHLVDISLLIFIAFSSGGMLLTVKGHHLGSVARPQLVIYDQNNRTFVRVSINRRFIFKIELVKTVTVCPIALTGCRCKKIVSRRLVSTRKP